MRQSKFTETQIVSILKEADAGRPVNELWRQHGISSATYYKWNDQVRRAGSLGCEATEGIGAREQPPQANVCRSVFRIYRTRTTDAPRFEARD
jgi:transposase-like protein